MGLRFLSKFGIFQLIGVVCGACVLAVGNAQIAPGNSQGHELVLPKGPESIPKTLTFKLKGKGDNEMRPDIPGAVPKFSVQQFNDLGEGLAMETQKEKALNQIISDQKKVIDLLQKRISLLERLAGVSGK